LFCMIKSVINLIHVCVCVWKRSSVMFEIYSHNLWQQQQRWKCKVS
jgi:hypothetical protein